MTEPMNHMSPRWEPRRIPPVEPDLLASALFIFSEYIAQLSAEQLATHDEEAEDAEADEELPVDTRAVLDRLAEELGSDPKTTLALYIRVTALFRLMSAAPKLAGIATDGGEGDELSPEAIAAAARLELYPSPDSEAPGDFDPREFREALEAD
jgi:hypothetical protein